MSYEAAWLRYESVTENNVTGEIAQIVCDEELREHPVVASAIEELQEAFEKMFGRELAMRAVAENVRSDARAAEAGEKGICTGKALVLTLCGAEPQAEAGQSGEPVVQNSIGTAGLRPQGYCLTEKDGSIYIEGADANGILYGTFAFLRKVAMGEELTGLSETREPVMPFRMLNHWDNMDGSIERGYSGRSFFFAGNDVLVDDRTKMYARLAASVGINAVVINNVNVKDAATYMITDRYFEKLDRMAEVFAAYGIRLYMSLNYAAPIELGELDTADPLDAKVQEWWKKKMAEVFGHIQNLGGFLVKADSEGRPGPFTYGRTHADGANMLADAVAPFGGIIVWRCFVYNCQQDWRDFKTDRARSGYDNFAGLDGSFRDNVILQIKNGPMDFQVREPVHPLFGGMRETNQMLEVQIAQEYTGQQRHVCYLIPMFKEVLAFRTYVDEENDSVRDIVSGKTFGQSNCGMAAVANTGNDENWTGHDMAAANFYGFGRLCFEPDLSSREIAGEWAVLTFGRDAQVTETMVSILMDSWPAYEKYNAPLGIGWMVNPHEHYGPSVDGYEYDRWGTYHRADHLGIGVDRSHKGTGFAMQYHPQNAAVYDDMEKCPDELLLFFHHVPYTHVLHSGKTVLQHIYDTHFEGVEMADEMVARFLALEGKIDAKRFERMKERFMHQKWHAREWRDQINSYFFRKSGVGDAHGRKIY